MVTNSGMFRAQAQREVRRFLEHSKMATKSSDVQTAAVVRAVNDPDGSDNESRTLHTGLRDETFDNLIRITGSSTAKLTLRSSRSCLMDAKCSVSGPPVIS